MVCVKFGLVSYNEPYMESGTGERLCPSTKQSHKKLMEFWIEGLLRWWFPGFVQTKHHPEKWVRRSVFWVESSSAGALT